MDIKSILRKYLDLMPDKADEQTTIEVIRQGISFRGANLWVLICAILIASLGLNVNSTAVIIGAMLISPLMGPIIGMGLGVGIYDTDLLRRSFKNYAIATFISIVTATFYFILTPFRGDQSELLARTSPTIYDVLIAFFGGAAGIIATGTKGKNNVLPGVAIATALMPPLCTAGYGLAEGNWHYFFGAFYLFLINSIFICDASVLGLRLLRFEHKNFGDHAIFHKVRRRIIIFELIILVPAAYTTVVSVRDGIFDTHVKEFVEKEMNIHGTQIIDTEADRKAHTLRLVAVGNEITSQQVADATDQLAGYKLGGYKLRIIQGSIGDSVLRAGLLNANTSYAQTLQSQSTTIEALRKELKNYRQYEDYSADMIDEMRLLYPSVQSLSLATTTTAIPADIAAATRDRATSPDILQNDSAKPDNVFAIVRLQPGTHLAPDVRTQMRQWVEARTNTDSVQLITLEATTLTR